MDTHFAALLRQIKRNGPNTKRWVVASKDYFPAFMQAHEVLNHFQDRATIIMHGSTSLNVDDPHSDLDFWLILDEEEERQFYSVTEESFVPLRINGKVGHINPLPKGEIDACFEESINMVLAYEIQHGIAVVDKKGIFEKYKTLANEPLTDSVRYAHFFRNYIEMRASHRSCDNPMERHDHFAMLYNVMDTLKFALQAAFVLDRMPYPYDKWIYAHAHIAETPGSLLPGINRILARITSGLSELHGPEKENRISQELRSIRAILIEKAKESGINEPWLNKWWRYIEESKRAVEFTRWMD